MLDGTGSNEITAGPVVRTARPADLGELDYVIYEGVDDYADGPAAEQRIEWIASAAAHHLRSSAVFQNLAEGSGFSVERFVESGDPSLIPLVSSGMFKRTSVESGAVGEMRTCLSSGTSGQESIVLRDRITLERFVGTVLHGLREFQGHSEQRRAFILGPEGEEAESTWFGYVLTLVQLHYDTWFFVVDGELRPELLFEALRESRNEGFSTIVGPPALLADFLDWMAECDLRLDLSGTDPYVITAGGWKRREAGSVDREVLTARVEDRLGIKPAAVRDAYNMVELNSVVFECEARVKHVPPWVTAMARRAADLSVAEPGELGVLAFLDPTARSYPAFVLSDDVGSVSEGTCPCGRAGQTVSLARRLKSIEQRGCGLRMERYAKGRS